MFTFISCAQEDDDDLFGEKKPTPKKTKTKRSEKDIFADTTDIFADIPSKPKEKKKKKQDQGIFGDVPGGKAIAHTLGFKKCLIALIISLKNG